MQVLPISRKYLQREERSVGGEGVEGKGEREKEERGRRWVPNWKVWMHILIEYLRFQLLRLSRSAYLCFEYLCTSEVTQQHKNALLLNLSIWNLKYSVKLCLLTFQFGTHLLPLSSSSLSPFPSSPSPPTLLSSLTPCLHSPSPPSLCHVTLRPPPYSTSDHCTPSNFCSL